MYNVLSSSVYTVQSSTVYNGASFIKSYCTLFVKLLEYGRTGLLGLCLLDLVIQKREDVVDELLLQTHKQFLKAQIYVLSGK